MSGEINTTELRRLIAAATPGQWSSNDYYKDDVITGEMHIADMRGWGYLTSTLKLSEERALEQQQANAAFIVAAHNAMPALLDAIDAKDAMINDHTSQRNGMQHELDELRAAIKAKGGTEHAPTQDAYDAACRALENAHAALSTLQERCAAAEADLGEALSLSKSCDFALCQYCANDTEDGCNGRVTAPYSPCDAMWRGPQPPAAADDDDLPFVTEPASSREPPIYNIAST